MTIATISFTLVSIIFSGLLFNMTNNPLFLMTAMGFGGAGFLTLVTMGYMVHPYRLEKIQTIKYYEDQLAMKLEDDMALMNAIYNKIENSYKPFLAHDFYLYEDRIKDTGLKIDRDRIEIMYYDYLHSPDLNEHIKNAMTEYSKPEYDFLL